MSKTKLLTTLTVGGALVVAASANAEEISDAQNFAEQTEQALLDALQLQNPVEMTSPSGVQSWQHLEVSWDDEAMNERFELSVEGMTMPENTGFQQGEESRLDRLSNGDRFEVEFLISANPNRDLSPELDTDFLPGASPDSMEETMGLFQIIAVTTTSDVGARPTLQSLGGAGDARYGMPSENPDAMGGASGATEADIPFFESGEGNRPLGYTSGPGQVNPDATGSGGADIDESMLAFDIDTMTDPLARYSQPSPVDSPSYNADAGELQFEFTTDIDLYILPEGDGDRY